MNLGDILTLFNGDVLSPNFFGLLTGKNQGRNLALLCEIDDFFGDRASGVDRNELVSHLEKFIGINRLDSIGADDDSESSETTVLFASKNANKASSFISGLVKRRWLEEDTSEFVVTERRSSAFIYVVRALKQLLAGQTGEYATPIIAIYNALQGWNLGDNPVFQLENIQRNRQEIADELNSIESNIKSFVSKSLNNKEQSDQELLETLIVRYHKEKFYIAFIRLLGDSSPTKFRAQVVGKLTAIWEEQKDIVIREYIKTKDLPYGSDEERRSSEATAERWVRTIVIGTINLFNEIGKDIDDIAKRNENYVRITGDKLRFRLNQDKNINGLIDEALRSIKNSHVDQDEDLSSAFSVGYFKQLAKGSLYSPRKLVEQAPKALPVQRKVNESLLARAKRLQEATAKFSKKAVTDFILRQLGEKDTMMASEITINSEEDLIMLVLAPVYGTGNAPAYRIRGHSESRFDRLGYSLADYTIRKERLYEQKK